MANLGEDLIDAHEEFIDKNDIIDTAETEIGGDLLDRKRHKRIKKRAGNQRSGSVSSKMRKSKRNKSRLSRSSSRRSGAKVKGRSSGRKRRRRDVLDLLCELIESDESDFASDLFDRKRHRRGGKQRAGSKQSGSVAKRMRNSNTNRNRRSRSSSRRGVGKKLTGRQTSTRRKRRDVIDMLGELIDSDESDWGHLRKNRNEQRRRGAITNLSRSKMDADRRRRMKEWKNKKFRRGMSRRRRRKRGRSQGRRRDVIDMLCDFIDLDESDWGHRKKIGNEQKRRDAIKKSRQDKMNEDRRNRLREAQRRKAKKSKGKTPSNKQKIRRGGRRRRRRRRDVIDLLCDIIDF